MICASVNRFFTPDLPFRMIGLSTEVLLKMGGTSRGGYADVAELAAAARAFDAVEGEDRGVPTPTYHD